LEKLYKSRLCINCGTELSQNDKFCANCGQKIENNSLTITDNDDSKSQNKEKTFLMGKKYLYGTNVNKDYKQAIIHFSKSFALGKKEAAYHMAIAYVHLAMDSLHAADENNVNPDKALNKLHEAISILNIYTTGSAKPNIASEKNKLTTEIMPDDDTVDEKNAVTGFAISRFLAGLITGFMAGSLFRSSSENKQTESIENDQQKKSDNGFFSRLDDLLNDFSDDGDSFLDNSSNLLDENDKDKDENDKPS